MVYDDIRDLVDQYAIPFNESYLYPGDDDCYVRTNSYYSACWFLMVIKELHSTPEEAWAELMLLYDRHVASQYDVSKARLGVQTLYSYPEGKPVQFEGWQGRMAVTVSPANSETVSPVDSETVSPVDLEQSAPPTPSETAT